MMATARQLEIFITVVETGSMRQTANLLGISQPSVSRQLRALEAAVGGELFLRARGKTAHVSPFGAALVHDARETLRHHNQLRRRSGHKVANCPMIFVRPYLLGQMKTQMPALYAKGLPRDARFTVVDDAQDMVALVEAEKGSVGVFRTDYIPTDGRVISMLIRSDAGSLYCAPELAAKTGSKADIRKLDILVPAQQPGLEAFTARLLARAGVDRIAIKPGPAFIELLLEKVLEGRGAAAFFDDTVRELVDQGRLERLLDVSEPYYLVLLANKAVDPRLLTSIGDAFREI